jgi:lipopolysaccharide export system protein LptA
MNKLMLSKIKLFLIIYLLKTSICYALISDESKPIEISSNYAVFDQKNKVYKFTGNIFIKRGSINIYADNGIVNQIGESIKQIKLYGTPIKFFQKQDDNEMLQGECNNFYYDSVTGNAILIGNAKIIKGKVNVSGNLIKYNTKTEIYSVEGTKSSGVNNKLNDRITIILDDVGNATKSVK